VMGRCLFIFYISLKLFLMRTMGINMQVSKKDWRLYLGSHLLILGFL